jgi:hypothetical protein
VSADAAVRTCPVCDRPFAYDTPANPHTRPDLCWRPVLKTAKARSWAYDECSSKSVDWQARALRAEAQVAPLLDLAEEVIAFASSPWHQAMYEAAEHGREHRERLEAENAELRAHLTALGWVADKARAALGGDR